MRSLDFSSWQALLSTVAGLAFITLVAVGIRLLVMQTVQQRRERENGQINERLRTLIAAYKTLGGSFTGDLSVDPRHLRDLRPTEAQPQTNEAAIGRPHSERARRIRDAVESALSDVILLGTESQVRLAAHAAGELVAGRAVHTADLVVALRDFIRQVLNLEAMPRDLAIPKQGPARNLASKGANDEGAKDGGKKGGLGEGGGAGLGSGATPGESDPHHEP